MAALRCAPDSSLRMSVQLRNCASVRLVAPCAEMPTEGVRYGGLRSGAIDEDQNGASA